jgi:hypothetical protein
MARKKNPAAVALGRRGGRKKVPKGFSMLDEAQRKEMARQAARSRWENKKKKK